MQNKAKNCNKCQEGFVIEAEDFAFYEKIGVPEPSLCPECRQQARYLWRNERTLYRRNCDLSGNSIVSMYAPGSPFKVYGIKDWWGDEWDPKDYMQEIDFTRPFFEQFRELQLKVPRMALLNKNNTNSDFCNHTNNSKDCFMCCTAFDCENILYCTNTIPLKNSLDCYDIRGTSNENLYECISVANSYNCQYCLRVEDSFDCFYSFDLRNCSNCFLSCNLRNQSYYFLNQKYTREQYKEKIKEFNLSSYEVREQLYNVWKELIFENALHRGTIIESSQDCIGNMINESKNAKQCFDVITNEDSKYIIYTLGLKDSYDVYHGGINCELMYQVQGVVRSSNIIGAHLSYDNTNLYYCDSCHNSNELFGCVGIKKGSFMIFNKQYSKEDYLVLKEKLIAHMKETGEYGNFFPKELSPFAYNESMAQIYMPLSKEEAVSQGFIWRDNMPGTYGKETMKSDEIPDSIVDIDDSITDEVLVCANTGRNFNIVKEELELYRRFHIPIPRIHPDERYKNRNLIRPDRKLYDAVCSVSGIAIKSAYPSERRPRNTVSDEIYKKEVL